MVLCSEILTLPEKRFEKKILVTQISGLPHKNFQWEATKFYGVFTKELKNRIKDQLYRHFSIYSLSKYLLNIYHVRGHGSCGYRGGNTMSSYKRLHSIRRDSKERLLACLTNPIWVAYMELLLLAEEDIPFRRQYLLLCNKFKVIFACFYGRCYGKFQRPATASPKSLVPKRGWR